MSRLEDDLRNAYRRQQPPSGFEARLLERLRNEPQDVGSRLRRWFQTPALRLAWAGALAVVLVAGVRFEQQRQERERGQQAKQQLMLALQVTGGHLQAIHEKVRSGAAAVSIE